MSNHDFKDDVYDEHLGLMTSYRWNFEPRGVLFMLARYKFVMKMLDGFNNVLEVGCGDGFGSRLVRTAVKRLTCIDIDAQMIASAKEHQAKFDIKFECTDELLHYYDAIYSLDVLEHIEHEASKKLLEMLSHRAPVVIIGTPSLEAQPYASPLSRENHINCMRGAELKALMQTYFKHVFMFAVNDEVTHTGNFNMAHYNIAMGVN